MSEETNNERALTRIARASWVNAQRGARLTAESARSWARAEDIEAIIKEQDARALSAAVARNARKRARAGKRAHTIPAVSAHPMSAHEVKARAFRTRALRSGVSLIAPCALIAAPPWMAINGDPGALIAWPAAYGYLAWTGFAFKRAQEREDEPTIELEAPKRGLFQKPKSDASLPPTVEETAIIGRIHSWEANAAERRLHEVFPGNPVIDESGLLIPITFAGQWTPAKLDSQADQFRALLAVPDQVRTQVKPGGTADRAIFRVRTRIRELDLTWTPEREGHRARRRHGRSRPCRH